MKNQSLLASPLLTVGTHRGGHLKFGSGNRLQTYTSHEYYLLRRVGLLHVTSK